MINKFKALLKRPAGRYLIVGGSVYVLEVIVIVAAQKFGANPTLAVGIGFWVGLVTSFGFQKILTFGDRRVHHKVLLPQIIAYTLLVIFNFSFTIIVTHLLSPPAPAVAVRTLALGITTIWNFYIYKTHIFENTEKVVY